MSAFHPLTMLTWFLWGFFMGLGFATAYGLVCGLKALAIKFHDRVKWPRVPAKRKGPKWEYMIVNNGEDNVHQFNVLGEEGWELVGVVPGGYWFKRSLP